MINSKVTEAEDPKVLENLSILNFSSLKSLSTIALANEYMILSSTFNASHISKEITSENVADAIRCELNKRLEMM